ncbi:MAG: beta-galactosidase, partial [Candidatus Wallbacteria bacterium]|nr:beta-galactosidase [Candidatus Wallbacteria bacterium]
MHKGTGWFTINGKPEFIFSGEIHYFRIPRDQWVDRLNKAKLAGLNTVASYIPWGLHEPEEGRFEFRGESHPELDVMEFIRLTQEHGLWFIPRIGPMSQGEMINEGLPEWLLRDYPEAFNRPRGGHVLHHQGSPAYATKVFREKTRTWYDQVLPLLVPLQHPQGNMPVFQLCNEIGCINWVGKKPDHSPEAEQMYREFMLQRYGSLKAINSAYGMDLSAEIDLVQPGIDSTREHFQRWLDWGDFYRHYYADYYAYLAQIARKHGVTTHLIANIPQFYDFDVRGRGLYSPVTTLMFSEFGKKTQGVIFGGAYQMRRLDYENFHDILLTTEHVKSVSGDGLPAICAELQTGVLSDKPKLYPSDVELNLKTSLSSGLNGINCYMFAGGVNFRGLGQFGPYHEWQAPVDSAGKLRPHYEPLRRFGRLIENFGSVIAPLPKRCDLTLGFYGDHFKTAYLNGDLPDELYGNRNKFYFDGLVRLLSMAGYSYNAIDLCEPVPDSITHLAVSSFCFMSTQAQQHLLHFVRRGGHLLLAGELLFEDSTLLQGLGIRACKVQS